MCGTVCACQISLSGTSVYVAGGCYTLDDVAERFHCARLLLGGLCLSGGCPAAEQCQPRARISFQGATCQAYSINRSKSGRWGLQIHSGGCEAREQRHNWVSCSLNATEVAEYNAWGMDFLRCLDSQGAENR